MKRGMILLMLAIFLVFPGVLWAQMHGGGMHGGSGGMMGQRMMHNMGMMHQMMGDMQQMMGQGHMTPEQQQQML
jgi:hypothetical protein